MEGFLKMVKRIKNRDLTPLFHMGIFVLTVVFIFALLFVHEKTPARDEWEFCFR